MHKSNVIYLLIFAFSLALPVYAALVNVSLGMSYTQSLIKVVLPQAIRNSIPAIGNEFIVNIPSEGGQSSII